MSRIDTPAMLNQIMIRKWAYYGSSHLGNDLFYLKELIDLSIQHFGEEELIVELKSYTGRNKSRLNVIGNDWLKFKRNYKRLSREIATAKIIYDKIQNKTFSKIENKDFQQYLRYIERLDIINDDLYALAIFFMKNSNYRGQTIKSQEWMVLENSNLQKLEITKRKPELLPTKDATS